ncbi:MAG: GNAT family N-acetyltransferase [Kiloniellales bacterium]|nr:GNAT family N-acetyltransferase [Kiloniellales bacterium]MDJ0972433.1 GNAT family N-acetyltransferase [Kiloniellales bacterium]MDJ0980162.1 GNAT family N-acetyltransferase [Kiloniellales bacterium]
MTPAPSTSELAAPDFVPLWRARDHLPVLADWLWRAWGRDEGYAVAETRDWLSDLARADRRETGVVALSDGEPLGVALLCNQDLDCRKNLSPWLSSLFVQAAARNRGIGGRLVREIEQAAIERRVPTLYLYTPDQGAFYAKRGWRLVERLQLPKGEADLMCKELAGAGRQSG